MLIFGVAFLFAGEGAGVELNFISGEDLYDATAIAVDAQDRIFITDAGNHCVLCFDAQGEKLFAFGREGQGPGEFSRPTDIGFLSDGRLLVGDGGNRRVQIFDAKGQYQNTIKIPDQPVGQLLVLPDDTFALTRMAGSMVVLNMGETQAHRFQIYDLGGKKQRSFGTFATDENPLLESMINHGAIGLLGDKIVFAGVHTPELIIYDPAQEERYTYPLSFVPREPKAQMEQTKNPDGSISFQMGVEVDTLCTALAVISGDDLVLLRKTKSGDDSDEIDDELIRIDQTGKLKETYEGAYRARAMAVSRNAAYAYILHELDDEMVVARVRL